MQDLLESKKLPEPTETVQTFHKYLQTFGGNLFGQTEARELAQFNGAHSCDT